MGTTAAASPIGVGSVVTLPDGTQATVDVVAGDICECVWFVGFDAHRGTFALADLRPAGAAPLAPSSAPETASADISDEDAAAFNGGATLELLLDFLRWLSTRDERVGPFDQHHPLDTAQASRVAAEYLAEHA